MHQIVNKPPQGFTIIELVIAFVIMGVLAALATPSMMNWILRTSVRSASEFYAEGLQMARVEAIRRNVSTRFVIGTPDTNGWAIDWCQATSNQPCDEAGTWNNIVQRSGTAFDNISISYCPGGSNEVDFTSLGWVNTQFIIPMAAVRIMPSTSEVRSSQVEIPLSGIPMICSPEAVDGDSRVCQVVCP